MNADAIAGFWSWWAGARDRFAAAIDAGEMGPELVDELGARVEAIAPGLAWELGRERRRPMCSS